MSSLSEAHDDHMRQTGLEAQENKDLQTETVQFGFEPAADHWQTHTTPETSSAMSSTSDPWQTTPTLDLDSWQTTPTLDSSQAVLTNPATLSTSSDPWQAAPILDTPWQTSESSQAIPTSGTNLVTPPSSDSWQDALVDPSLTSGPTGTAWQATPTSGTSVNDALPTSRLNGTDTGQTVPTPDADGQHNTDTSRPEEFEVFVDVEPVRTGCCACFHRPRRRQYSSVPRLQERTVEGSGLSNVGDSLRQVDPLRSAGHGLRDVGGLKTVGNDLRQVEPLRKTGQEVSKARPLRNAGLGLRGLVGLGKPRRPEDGFTDEEERAFLLKCDQLENDDLDW